MAKQHKLVGELANAWGFKENVMRQSAYGVRDGYPMQMTMVTQGNGQMQLNAIIRLGDKNLRQSIEQALAQSPAIASSGLKSKQFEVSEDVLVVKFFPGFRGFGKAPEITNQLQAVLQSVATIAAGPGLKCSHCSKTVTEPMLVNGVVNSICEGCLERMQEETRQARDAYNQIPMNMGRATLAGATCALLGAAAWGGVIVMTDSMYWLLAIGIGYFVGWGTVKSAGRGGKPIQVISAVFSVLSVLIGLLFYVGVQISKEMAAEGKAAEWLPLTIGLMLGAPSILISMGGTTLFTLGGGLLGAVYAAKLAQQPKIELVIEK